MNQSLLSFCLITLGIGLCGFFGAQLPSTVYKHTSLTMARDWVQASKLKSSETSSTKETQNQLINQISQLKITPSTRLKQWSGERGVFFTLGLLMILIGSLWSRRIAYNTLQANVKDDQDQPNPHAIDFSILLSEISLDLNVIRDQLVEVEDESKFLESQNQEILSLIDQLQKEKIARLITAKDQVQIKYGLTAFTEIFGPFSQGERRLNRCWSALVDKHLKEAQESAIYASQSIEEAVLVLEQLSNQNT